VYSNGGTVLLVGYLFFPKNEARFFFLAQLCVVRWRSIDLTRSLDWFVY
jgi:hypothetical protein